MKTLFLWTNISGYMAACWRKASEDPDVDLRVLAYGHSSQTEFAVDLMSGIDWRALSEAERTDVDPLWQEVESRAPDMLVVSGWLNPAYREVVKRAHHQGIQTVMCMDTPWWGTARQWVGRIALRSYLRHVDDIWVTGERAWQYAIRLGHPRGRIHRGMYGVDVEGLSPLYEQRCALPEWPRRFLFIGRYEEEKGLDVLVEAYRRYRVLVQGPDKEERIKDKEEGRREKGEGIKYKGEESKEDSPLSSELASASPLSGIRGSAAPPWELHCCGKGPLAHLLKDQPGVVDHGFVQPEEVKTMMVNSGALVLPSRFDPWPLALVEGCAAGLPVICTDACGSAVELIRPQANGLMVDAGNEGEMAKSMMEMHRKVEIREWALTSQHLSVPYAASFWLSRLKSISGSQSFV